MPKFYSPQTGAFYAPEIHGANMPSDVVEITDQQHADLMAGQSSGKRITPDGRGRPVLTDPPLTPTADRRANAKRAIDQEAGNARARFVSAGQFQAEEYLQAEQSARAWVDAGRPEGSVPGDVQAWADVSGMTASESADDILATAQSWRATITTIRQIRLAGKAAVDAAEDQGSAGDMASVAAPYVQQLKDIKP